MLPACAIYVDFVLMYSCAVINNLVYYLEYKYQAVAHTECPAVSERQALHRDFVPSLKMIGTVYTPCQMLIISSFKG